MLSANCALSSAVDLLKCVHDVEEAIVFVHILLVDLTQRSITLHQVLSVGKQNHALVFIASKLKLLADNGHNLRHFECARHQKPEEGR